MQSFIFGKGQEYSSPEELAKARALAEALLGPQRAPQNVGEGLTALGYAIRGRMDMNRINKAEKAGRASATGALSPLYQALRRPSGGSAPVSPSVAAQAPANPNVGSTIDFAKAGQPDIRKGLIDRGLPEHVADAFVMNFKDESGLNPGINETSPVVPGSRGGFGLSQWTGPRRKALEAFAAERGAPVSDANTQLDFLMTELQGPEKAAFQTIMAAPDKGTAAAAILNNFLRPAEAHRAKREAAYLGSNPPAQVASLDPSAGMPPAGQNVAQALIAPNNRGNIAMPDGSQAQGAFPPPPIPRGADAGISNGQQLVGTGRMMTGTNGGTAPVVEPGNPQMAQSGGVDLNMLLEAASNPWLNDQERAVVNMLLEQQMQASDPKSQLELQKLQRELSAAPERKTTTINGRLVDTQTGQEIANFPDEPAKPAGVQEYEYAKQQGFPGTFQDWEASKRGGMSLQVDPATGEVLFQQGGNIKPLTEGQSKDTVFSTRAAGALPLIDKFGDALTSLPETMGGQVPGVGNYMKSPEFQQAEQAGKEFLQAILRKDTGAAIKAEETQEYGTVYLPRPGDSPALLEQKKASRIRALEAIKAGMPPQAILMQERALENTNKKAPVVIDGYTIEEVE